WRGRLELPRNEGFGKVAQVVHVRLRRAGEGRIAGWLVIGGQDALRRAVDVMRAARDLAKRLEGGLDAGVRPRNRVRHPLVVLVRARLVEIDLRNPVGGW